MTTLYVQFFIAILMTSLGAGLVWWWGEDDSVPAGFALAGVAMMLAGNGIGWSLL